MGQAKTLTERELKRVLDYIALHRHAARNRAMVMLTYYAGLRVSEVANLKYADVVAADCTIKAQFQLTAEQVKGGHARMVFVGEKLSHSEARRFLTQHAVPALPLALSACWGRGRKQPFGSPHLHHQPCVERGWGSGTGVTCRTSQHRDHAGLYRRERRSEARCGSIAVGSRRGSTRLSPGQLRFA
jgi:hypothetical protein